MSKYNTKDLWNERYGSKEEVEDYAGRLMKKSACGDPNSKYHPTIDHICPLSKGGLDIKGNIEICHRTTNEEKGDTFSTWKTNGRTFQGIHKKGTTGEYEIKEVK